MERQQKEIKEFFFSKKHKEMIEKSIMTKIGENGKVIAVQPHDWFVLTPQGWKEFTECTRQGFYPNGVQSHTGATAFFATDDPQTFHRNRATNKCMYSHGIETTEMTKEKLQAIEQAFMQQHKSAEK